MTEIRQEDSQSRWKVWFATDFHKNSCRYQELYQETLETESGILEQSPRQHRMNNRVPRSSRPYRAFRIASCYALREWHMVPIAACKSCLSMSTCVPENGIRLCSLIWYLDNEFVFDPTGDILASFGSYAQSRVYLFCSSGDCKHLRSRRRKPEDCCFLGALFAFWWSTMRSWTPKYLWDSLNKLSPLSEWFCDPPGLWPRIHKKEMTLTAWL
jgi:hypothetical protein